MVERVARASYGRLLALLAAPPATSRPPRIALARLSPRRCAAGPSRRARQSRGLAAHGGAQPAARSAAIGRAPPQGLPHRPVEAEAIDLHAIPDRRLALLFVCAHPAIDAAVRTPLMLQTVLGSEARSIARAFAIPEPTLAKRLTRAKRRIRDARIPFSIPDRSHMASRLTPVLEAIYGAYAIDWQIVSGVTPRESLATEAHYLAVLLAELLPEEPEVLGLAALLSLSLSRAAARGSKEEFIPLEEQDTARWDRALIARGESYLHRAQSAGSSVGSSWRPRSSRCTARGRPRGPPTGGRSARSTRRWPRSRPRWRRGRAGGHHRPRGGDPTAGWPPSMPSPIRRRFASSPRGRPARTCWPRRAGWKKPSRRTERRSRSPRSRRSGVTWRAGVEDSASAATLSLQARGRDVRPPVRRAEQPDLVRHRRPAARAAPDLEAHALSLERVVDGLPGFERQIRIPLRA